jgi:hypothetical protein
VATARLGLGCLHVSSDRPLSLYDHNECYFFKTQVPCKPDAQKQIMSTDRTGAFLVSLFCLGLRPFPKAISLRIALSSSASANDRFNRLFPDPNHANALLPRFSSRRTAYADHHKSLHKLKGFAILPPKFARIQHSIRITMFRYDSFRRITLSLLLPKSLLIST